jgi:hypothetical protein
MRLAFSSLPRTRQNVQQASDEFVSSAAHKMGAGVDSDGHVPVGLPVQLHDLEGAAAVECRGFVITICS